MHIIALVIRSASSSSNSNITATAAKATALSFSININNNRISPKRAVNDDTVPQIKTMGNQLVKPKALQFPILSHLEKSCIFNN
jgi:hypothetical protein